LGYRSALLLFANQRLSILSQNSSWLTWVDTEESSKIPQFYQSPL